MVLEAKVGPSPAWFDERDLQRPEDQPFYARRLNDLEGCGNLREPFPGRDLPPQMEGRRPVCALRFA